MKKIILPILAILFLWFMFSDTEEYPEDYEDEASYEDSSDDESFWGDDEEETDSDSPAFAEHIPVEDTGTDWVMYWYLCGSDLESNYGSATSDLEEMMAVDLPEGVKVVIQTGGAYTWENSFVDPNYTERYVYDSNGLQLIEQLPVTNMGDPNTLVDFLNFAETNYPGDRTMLNFWNHGGGSVTGVAFDELYNNDSLTLPELYTSMEAVYGANPEYYPLDIVGFDTCLMATLATANTFANHANFMVASQELEPGNGWYYTGIMEAMADNPTISPAELGVEICDTYVYGCEQAWTEDEITLSVTDLSKLYPLISAYDAYGIDVFSHSIENPEFFNRLAQVADSSENYGGNTRSEGYTNMVDLGQLVMNTSDLFPETSQAVLDALNNAVIYKIGSIYRPDGMGLSTFYTYDHDIDHLYSFMEVNPAPSFTYLYHYGLTGYVDDTGMQYLAQYMNYTDPVPVVRTVKSEGLDWEGKALSVDEEGSAVLDLGPEAYDLLSFITFELYYTPVDSEIILTLGTDNDLISDWENGIFTDNFRGVWGHIDGALCYMELVYEGDDYNEYAVPVLLNGEEYNLNVIYDFNNEEFIINGARKPLSEEGAADKNMVELQVGDVIETIHYASDINSDSDEFEAFVVDTITVTEETAITEEWLPDGYYFFTFCMEDAQGNQYYSDIATFESADGELFTYYE